jgi:hypothetical protein
VNARVRAASYPNIGHTNGGGGGGAFAVVFVVPVVVVTLGEVNDTSGWDTFLGARSSSTATVHPTKSRMTTTATSHRRAYRGPRLGIARDY